MSWRRLGLWALGAIITVVAYTSVVFAFPIHTSYPCQGWFGYCVVRDAVHAAFGGEYTRREGLLLYGGPLLGTVLMVLAGWKAGVLPRWLAPGLVLACVLGSAYLLGTIWVGWPMMASPSVTWTIARWAPLAGLTLGAAVLVAGRPRAGPRALASRG